MKKALITGITGQDGIYLSRFLLNKGYKVFGLRRRTSSFTTRPLGEFIQSKKYSENFHLIYGDLTDPLSIVNALKISDPDEVYNLAAQSHVDVSFVNPSYTIEATGMGTLNILEAIRLIKKDKVIKFYQASTSELFGDTLEKPQNENTLFKPNSPYACAKHLAFNITKLYREAYGMFNVNGILFNHESPFRGETFVTRKITRAFASIKNNKQTILRLGNLNAKRDWGHAEDFVEAMWLMLQHDKPEDFVIATGIQYTVRDFCNMAAKYFGYDLNWQGDGLDEVGIDKVSNKILVKVDKDYFRPAEVENLLGDASKAKKVLSWYPKKNINDLVSEMCLFDKENIK